MKKRVEMVCREGDFGRVIRCYVNFAGRPTVGMLLRGVPGSLADRQERVRQGTWARFWRYIGAA